MSKAKRNKNNRKDNRMVAHHLTMQQISYLDTKIADRMAKTGIPFHIIHFFDDGGYTLSFDPRKATN